MLEKLGGDIGISQTRWNLGRTSEKVGGDQLRKESDGMSHWRKGDRPQPGKGGRREATQHCITEGCHLYTCQYENLKSCKLNYDINIAATIHNRYPPMTCLKT